MAASVRLAASGKAPVRFYRVFSPQSNGICASDPGRSWRRENNSFSKQESSKADLPASMENPYKEPPKKCILCGVTADYKNVQLLSQFISPYTGHILGRHITGLCMKKQKEVAKAIKRSQTMGFMSVMYKDPVFHSDPKICSIKYPE